MRRIFILLAGGFLIGKPILHSAPRPKPPAEDVLSFINGNRLNGRLLGFERNSGLKWRHPFINPDLSIELSKVASITLASSSKTNSPPLSGRVFLANGDMLNGQIVTMNDRRLWLKTKYAGELKIDRAAVCVLLCKIPLDGIFFKDGPKGMDFVHLDNGDALSGKLIGIHDGRVQLTTSSLGKIDIPMARVAGFNLAAANRPPPPVPGSIQFLLQNGSEIAATFIEWKDGRVQLANPAFGNATLDAGAIKAIEFRTRVLSLSKEARTRLKRLLRDGKFLYEMRDFDEATEKFERAMMLDPTNEVANGYLRIINKFKKDPKLRVRRFRILNQETYP